MLTKIADGWWIDLSLITGFFIDKEAVIAKFMMTGYPGQFDLHNEKIISAFEKRLSEFYLDGMERHNADL